MLGREDWVFILLINSIAIRQGIILSAEQNFVTGTQALHSLLEIAHNILNYFLVFKSFLINILLFLQNFLKSFSVGLPGAAT